MPSRRKDLVCSLRKMLVHEYVLLGLTKLLPGAENGGTDPSVGETNE